MIYFRENSSVVIVCWKMVMVKDVLERSTEKKPPNKYTDTPPEEKTEFFSLEWFVTIID